MVSFSNNKTSISLEITKLQFHLFLDYNLRVNSHNEHLFLLFYICFRQNFTSTSLRHLLKPHFFNYPPASEASREVANLNERKNPHTPPVYCVKEFVCLLPNLTPIISGLFRLVSTSTGRNQLLTFCCTNVHLRRIIIAE